MLEGGGTMSQSLPRRDAIVQLLAGTPGPMRARDLATRLGVSAPSRPGFERLLENLAQEGVLRAMTGDRFSLATAGGGSKGPAEREGVLSVNPRGFGFVRAAGHEDLYVPEASLGGALHGDTVVARVVRRSALGSEGEVVRVVRRGALRVAGVIRRRGKSAWLEPDDARVRGPIKLPESAKASEGDAAVVTITRYPEYAEENPEGELLAVLGQPGEPRAEIAKVLLREGVDEQYAPDAVAEAERYGEEVAEAALEGREDWTALPLVTIDPEDARDHDDAVHVERADDGSFTAYVAIADVSHYVRPGTALDREALARGCSIYLPSRAVPMLPPALSSKLCSLLPDVVRLCLGVVVTLDAGAKVTGVRLARAFMRSQARLTYEGVARAFRWTTEGARSKKAESFVESLRPADALAQMLRTKRMRRGALDFQLPEPKVLLDPESGAPTGVVRRGQDPGVRRAYQLIEEMMLLANESAARFLVERAAPTIFRVHAPPDEAKLEQFVAIADEVGFTFELDEVQDPKKLSLLLRRLAKHPRAEVLQTLLLRAMKQAAYDTTNIGHFGLAAANYLHFTSPIRRYPDLAVHRVVHNLIEGRPAREAGGGEEKLGEAARQSSERERRAMEVEREVVDLYRALYMRGRLGETFEGTVTGVVGSGCFVTLDDPFVEVLVSAEAMGRDAYVLDDERLRFVGQRSGDSLGLGDRAVVTVEDVSLLRRTVYAWRHPPEVSGRRTPLRQSPFAPKTPAPPPIDGDDRPKRPSRARPTAKVSGRPGRSKVSAKVSGRSGRSKRR
jgi:ribonuclease R